MPVSAKKFCKGTFTSNAAAIENSEAIIANGSTFYAVLDRINKQTGDSGICGKAEHCHPAPKDRFNCKLNNKIIYHTTSKTMVSFDIWIDRLFWTDPSVNLLGNGLDIT